MDADGLTLLIIALNRKCQCEMKTKCQPGLPPECAEHSRAKKYYHAYEEECVTPLNRWWVQEVREFLELYAA